MERDLFSKTCWPMQVKTLRPFKAGCVGRDLGIEWSSIASVSPCCCSGKCRGSRGINPAIPLGGRDKVMGNNRAFLEAYREFKRSVDFSKGGVLPELDDVIWCMLMGIPTVPADEEDSPDAPLKALDQRVAILKAVFVEVNSAQSDRFLDRGLRRYDQACRVAKRMLREAEDEESKR